MQQKAAPLFPGVLLGFYVGIDSTDYCPDGAALGVLGPLIGATAAVYMCSLNHARCVLIISRCDVISKQQLVGRQTIVV